jgi:hypothetical protein
MIGEQVLDVLSRRVSNIDGEFFAERSESSFELVEPRLMVQAEQAVDIGAGNIETTGQIGFAHAGSQERVIEFDFGGLQARQSDRAALPATELAWSWNRLAMFDVVADDHFQRIQRHFDRLLFGVALRDSPLEVGESNDESAFFNVGFKESVKEQHNSTSLFETELFQDRAKCAGFDLHGRVAGNL